jgi:hypothetical protein
MSQALTPRPISAPGLWWRHIATALLKRIFKIKIKIVYCANATRWSPAQARSPDNSCTRAQVQRRHTAVPAWGNDETHDKRQTDKARSHAWWPAPLTPCRTFAPCDDSTKQSSAQPDPPMVHPHLPKEDHQCAELTQSDVCRGDVDWQAQWNTATHNSIPPAKSWFRSASSSRCSAQRPDDSARSRTNRQRNGPPIISTNSSQVHQQCAQQSKDCWAMVEERGIDDTSTWHGWHHHRTARRNDTAHAAPVTTNETAAVPQNS